MTSCPWRSASWRAWATTTPIPPLSCRSLTRKATFTRRAPRARRPAPAGAAPRSRARVRAARSATRSAWTTTAAPAAAAASSAARGPNAARNASGAAAPSSSTASTGATGAAAASASAGTSAEPRSGDLVQDDVVVGQQRAQLGERARVPARARRAGRRDERVVGHGQHDGDVALGGRLDERLDERGEAVDDLDDAEGADDRPGRQAPRSSPASRPGRGRRRRPRGPPPRGLAPRARARGPGRSRGRGARACGGGYGTPPLMEPALASRPARLAFVGQATFFEACSLGPGAHPLRHDVPRVPRGRRPGAARPRARRARPRRRRRLPPGDHPHRPLRGPARADRRLPHRAAAAHGRRRAAPRRPRAPPVGARPRRPRELRPDRRLRPAHRRDRRRRPAGLALAAAPRPRQLLRARPPGPASGARTVFVGPLDPAPRAAAGGRQGPASSSCTSPSASTPRTCARSWRPTR